MFVALWLPAAVFAGPAGLLADRVSPRLVLGVTAVVAAAACAALAAGGGLGVLLALVAVLGCANAFAQPAEFALLPEVADGHDLVRANGQVEFARYAGSILGPVAGGLLAAAGGARCAAGRRRDLPRTRGRRGRAAGEVGAPSRVRRARAHARGHRVPVPRRRAGPGGRDRLRLAAVDDRHPAAALFFAQEDLGTGASGYGVLMAVWGAGMALGALAVAPRFRLGAMACAAVAAVAAQGLGIAVPALWPRSGSRSRATCSAASRTASRTCSRAR